jgi:hypothetical protein
VLVRVINLSNGFAYGKRTDAEGNYRIDFLPAGEYSITAEKDGYQTSQIPRYLAEVNREKVIKPPPIQLIPLTAPPVPIPVSNRPAPGTLQANVADATLRGSATSEFIAALPIGGIRSFDTFALLVPGVAPPPATIGTGGPGIGNGVGTAGQFSVNGQRARANNFTIDGSDNNDQDVGVRRQGFTPSTAQSIESIREFQISTLLSNSEAGRNTGGQINVVTRSGTNEVYGEVHDFFTDSSLNSRDFFDLSGAGNPSNNPFTRNQAGATIGFPLLPNRLHLFGAFEQQIVNRVQESHFATPTLIERNSAIDFSNSRNPLGLDILDPSFYPLPNNPGGPYGPNTLTRIVPASGSGVLFAIKIDRQFFLKSKASTFSIRYNFTDDDTRIPAVDGAINSSITALTRTQNLSLSLNTELSQGSANQARFSYGRTALGFEEVEGNPLIFQSRSTSIDRTGDGLPDGRTGPIGRLLLSPFSPLGVDPSTFPQGRAGNTFQFADTFIFTHGRNTMKFGTDIRRVHLNSFLERNYRAQIAFTTGFIRLRNGDLITGNGANFAALGIPSDIFQALALTPDSNLGLRFTEIDLFAHDQFRVHPRLTFEFGLRYERNTVPVDSTGRLERSLRLMESDLQPFNPESAFAQTFLNVLRSQREFLGGREKIYEGDNNNFAPRVGLALDLSGNGRMALRAGYGLFYDPILGTLVSQSRNALPNFIPINFGSGILFPGILSANPAFIRFGENLDIALIQPGTINTIGLPANQFIEGLGRLLRVGGFFVGAGFGAGITLPEKNLRAPYVHQYSIAFEKALFDRYIISVAYAGTGGRRLIRMRSPNGGQFTPVAVRFVPGGADPVIIPLLRRPVPSLGAITIFESSAISSYHALQASLSRRLSEGLALQISYTYSHAIDDVSDIFELAGSPALAQDETNRREGLRSERGSANFDIRHRFTAAWHYELPFGKRSSIFGGFQLSGILTLGTGQPFTVNTSLDANFDGNLSDRLNTTEGLIRSDSGRTRIILAPGVDPILLLAQPDTDSPNNGSVGRNTFRAAGVASLDLALIKRFALGERQSATVRLEIFNALNRTHFGIPIRVLEAPGFGSSVNTSLPARTIQIAVRYQF